MKKILALAMALAMVATLFTGCGNSTTGGDNGKSVLDVIKIGVYEPASGENGAGGKQETLGVQYANSMTPTVDIGGKTYKVELVTADNESSTDKGPSAAATLVSAGVSVVLGSYGSGVSIAASDVFGKAKIPAIGITCTNPQVTEGNDHYFRICFLDPFQGTVLANFAADNFSAKKAYVLTKLGDDYSVGLGHYFQQAFEGLGGTVVTETFPEGSSDFSSYLTNAAKENADVIFAPVSTEAAALIIEQASAKGVKAPIMAGDTWDSNVILNAAKGKDVKVYVTTFYQEGGDPEFDKGIKKWINSNPTNLANNGGDDTVAAVSAMGFDAYYVALEALKAAGSSDPVEVNKALWDVKYKGVSGDIAFDEQGDAIRDVAYVKTANTETGAWDFVSVQGIK
ncbi:MAG: amino acid ABC transporter substrate-binding protein [Clostridia bacterium]|nr:amino acid ABC transporter substrate-binding protein [Clostridia bacterium]